MTKTTKLAAIVALTAGLAPISQAAADSVIVQSNGERTTVVTNGEVVYDGGSGGVGQMNCASAADAAMARSMGIVLSVCGAEGAGGDMASNNANSR